MKRTRIKTILTLAVAALLLTFTVSGTLAYLTTGTGDVVNTFEPAKVTCAVDESFAKNVKSDVKIQNTGTTSAYIRAKVVGNWVLGNKIVAPWTDDIVYNTKDWSKADGFWYYKSEVAAGEKTTNLFAQYEQPAAPVAGAHLELTIVCQAIQSKGMGATSAQDAFAIAGSN